MTNLHTVKIVEDESGLKIEFTCHGDRHSDCHFYPACDCEGWDGAESHEHPYTVHGTCWMQDWFDNGGISPASDSVVPGDLLEAEYAAGMEGPTETTFHWDYIEWNFTNTDMTQENTDD